MLGLLSLSGGISEGWLGFTDKENWISATSTISSISNFNTLVTPCLLRRHSGSGKIIGDGEIPLRCDWLREAAAAD